MKIYLAARYTRHPELQGYRADLEAAGHIVTSRWINGNNHITDGGLSEQAKEEERIRFAQEDRDDLEAADCIISFTEMPRATATRGGRHVELGMGLARGMRCVVVGHRENVFHCLPEIEFFPSWDGVVSRLAEQ